MLVGVWLDFVFVWYFWRCWCGVFNEFMWLLGIGKVDGELVLKFFVLVFLLVLW